jgi:acyl dehydratase
MSHPFTRSDNLYEDFTPGETIVHPRGRTVSDEHMMWTNFVLNTAQLHFNQKLCDDSPETTFNGRRAVYGGIVFAFVCGLAAEEGSALPLVRGCALGSLTMTCYGAGVDPAMCERHAGAAGLPVGVPADQTNM